MSSISSYAVRSPQWVMVYQGVNITADVSAMTVAVTYCDRLSTNSPELELELEDHQKLWQGPWYPSQGDQVSLQLGYMAEPLLDCGTFQIDQLELQGPPDTFTLRCLAAWITPAMRTVNHLAFEGQTLPQIAAIIAQKHNLTVVGAPNSIDVAFARITQQQSDLAFLRRLAREHGYDFALRGSQLIFYSLAVLEGAAAALSLARTDLIEFSFVDKTHEIYSGAQVSYQEPATKQLVTATVQASPAVPTTDTIKRVLRCENGPQALLKAQSILHEANKRKVWARLTLPGSQALVAGIVVSLTGFGLNDGNYLLETARHRLSRERGYVTEIEARLLQGTSTNSQVAA